MLVTGNKMITFRDANNKRRTRPPKFKLEKIGPGQFKKVEVIESEEPEQNTPKVEKRDLREKVVQDDFTVIKSVGVATSRILASRGIMTYRELRDAEDLSFLPANVVSEIEKWRETNG